MDTSKSHLPFSLYTAFSQGSLNDHIILYPINKRYFPTLSHLFWVFDKILEHYSPFESLSLNKNDLDCHIVFTSINPFQDADIAHKYNK